MHEKKVLSYSKKFFILQVIGLLLILNPIACDYDYCIDPIMSGHYINEETFIDYGEESPLPYLFKKKYVLDYISNSYGNIKKQVDFKRDFHMGFRNYPYRYGGKPEGTNFGLAVVFGHYPADSYKFNNHGPLFLVHGLEKSIAILFRDMDQTILVLNCLEKPCNVYNPDLIINYRELAEYRPLEVQIVYSASQHFSSYI